FRGIQPGRDDVGRRVLLAVFVGIDGRAQRDGACAVEPDHHRRTLRAADPGHPRGRRRFLRSEAIFRLWPRQRSHVSALGRCDHRADGGASHTGCRLRAPRQASADDLRIVGDDGLPVARGQVGELQVCGPTSAMAYWNNRQKSCATFHGPWTRSGDKYSIDGEGNFVYAGRTDVMLKVGGIYVSPVEVEAALI